MTDSIAEHYAYLLRAHEHLLGLTPRARRLELIARLIGTKPPEAFAIVAALEKTRGLRGDVCEIGVAQGATSALIANEILDGQSTLHLFDSFQGLSAPTDGDVLLDDVFGLGSMAAYAGQMACPVEMVAKRLEEISFPRERYMVHAGFLDKTLTHFEGLPKAVRFAYIDVDLHVPTKMALKWLGSVVVPGAVVVVDDYGFFSAGAKKAVDEMQNGGLWDVLPCHLADGHFCVMRRL
jgi:O-methyltransferase